MRAAGPLLLLAAACAPLAPLENRRCPCAEGFRCCEADDRCVAEGTACATRFTPNPALTPLGDGAAIDLGPFRCTSPPGEALGQCQRITEGAALRYDAAHHRFYLLGAGQTGVDSLFELNPDTLTWSALYAPTACTESVVANYDAGVAAWVSGPGAPWPRPIAAAAHDLFVPVPTTGELLAMHRAGILFDRCGDGGTRLPDFDGTIAHFAVDAGGWSFSATRGEDPGGPPASEWDPDLRQVVTAGQYAISVYDPVTKKRTELFAPPVQLFYDQELVRDGTTGRHLYFQAQAGKLYAVELERDDLINSRLVEVRFDGGFPPGPAGYAFDEASGVIVGAVRQGRASVYEPSTSAFTRVTVGDGGVGTMGAHLIAYDPVNNVHALVTDYADGYRTYVWRYRKSSRSAGPLAEPPTHLGVSCAAAPQGPLTLLLVAGLLRGARRWNLRRTVLRTRAAC